MISLSARYRPPVQFVVWGIVGILGLSVVTAFARVSGSAVLAVLHDMLPTNLVLAWVVLGIGLVTRNWALAVTSALLAGCHVGLVVTRRTVDQVPAWVASAPRLRVAVANVYIGNRTPADSVAGLLATDADLLVITERNPDFMSSGASVKAREVYRFIVDEPSSRPDYEIAIASRVELGPESSVVEQGPLRIVHARIECGARVLDVIGVHLTALVEPAGFRAWSREIRALSDYVDGLDPPFVIVGDFNSTAFRPALTVPLRAAGLRDGHRAAGKGLTRSLKFAAEGLLARLPAMARVDHVFVSRDVHVVDIENLPTSGSDHHPLLATLAVREDV